MEKTTDADQALQERLLKLALTKGVEPQVVVREAVEQYVQREEARNSLIEEADAAWSQFKQSGLHLSIDETEDWLKSWGRSPQQETPRCHK
ncbi:MAG: CopG family transcriptional regulator [Pseudomonadota bacterium]